MEERSPIRRVEDYTGAFLVTSGVLLFMAFLTIGALYGMAWVLLTALGLDRAIHTLPRLRQARRND